MEIRTYEGMKRKWKWKDWQENRKNEKIRNNSLCSLCSLWQNAFFAGSEQ